jgi:hypothetical protein
MKLSPGRRWSSALAAVIVLAALAASSCDRLGSGSLKLQPTPVLSGGLGYAVVKEAYARLKESPSDSSRDVDHLRRGGVYRLDERRLDGADAAASQQASGSSDAQVGIWYAIDSAGTKGWVRESELDIYGSQAQAEKAASAYR